MLELTISKEGELLKSPMSLSAGTIIYSSTILRSGLIALGTISDGLVIIDKKGNVQYDYDKVDGLHDNTVLSVFEDQDENIWAGLNNGISAIYQKSGIHRAVFDESGIGTVYASHLIDDILYLGTNQGLYCKDTKSKNPTYQIITGIEEQVWSLNVIDGLLLCGHNEGLFIVKDKRIVQKLSNPVGVWGVRRFPAQDNFLLIGAYSGLFVLERDNVGWRLRNKVADFNISAKFFEWADDHHVIVSHEYKGVYHIRLNSEYDKAIDVSLDQGVSKGRHAGLAKLGEDIYYSIVDGVWKYDILEDEFMEQEGLSSLQSLDEFISGKLVSTDQKLWMFSRTNIYGISKNNFDGLDQVKAFSVPLEFRSTKRGYEHINHLEKEKYLLSSSDGYSIIDLDLSESHRQRKLRIDEIVVSGPEGKKNAILGQEATFDSQTSAIEFYLSSAITDPLHSPRYEFKLNDNSWRSTSHQASHILDELQPGSYKIEFRDEGLPNILVLYAFNVEKPWHQTTMALIGFLALALLALFSVNKAYTRYYSNQQEELIKKGERQLELQELETQQVIANLENERLQADIENKNRELGISTMHTIKQNELLNSIKSKLESVKDKSELNEVIEIINKNLDVESDWLLFEKAFNEADSDFFKKVKVEHPALTPSDLKLCAYLRLNLSSKEMAPLLNISPRSVEIKRYRLRKKLNLSHEKDLVAYILEV